MKKDYSRPLRNKAEKLLRRWIDSKFCSFPENDELAALDRGDIAFFTSDLADHTGKKRAYAGHPLFVDCQGARAFYRNELVYLNGLFAGRFTDRYQFAVEAAFSVFTVGKHSANGNLESKEAFNPDFLRTALSEPITWAEWETYQSKYLFFIPKDRFNAIWPNRPAIANLWKGAKDRSSSAVVLNPNTINQEGTRK